MCYRKQIAMLQQNLTSHQLPGKIIQPSLTTKTSSHLKEMEKKIPVEMKMAAAVKVNGNVRYQLIPF